MRDLRTRLRLGLGLEQARAMQGLENLYEVAGAIFGKGPSRSSARSEAPRPEQFPQTKAQLLRACSAFGIGGDIGG